MWRIQELLNIFFLNVHYRKGNVTLQFESVVLSFLQVVGCIVELVSLFSQVQPAYWVEVLVIDVRVGEVNSEGVDLVISSTDVSKYSLQVEFENLEKERLF